LPSTKQLVKWIQLNANGWNRIGTQGILPILNEAQNILLQNETAQNAAYDNATGLFPSFDTEKEKYEYDMPKTIWRVGQILLVSPVSSDLNLDLNPEYGMESNIQLETENVFYNGRKYVRFPFVSTRDRTHDDACKVRFFTDPGDTEGIFLYRGYQLPTQLTSENIQLQIPEKYHMSVVMPAVQSLIDAFETGTWIDATTYIEEKLRPKLIEEMNMGEQGISHYITRREF